MGNTLCCSTNQPNELPFPNLNSKQLSVISEANSERNVSMADVANDSMNKDCLLEKDKYNDASNKYLSRKA